MKKKIQNIFKKFLISALPSSERARYLAYLPKLREWQSEHTEDHKIFKKRYGLYEYVNSEIIKEVPIDYLEFGVYKGRSIKYWSEKNGNPGSKFYGFDTFEGLPEKWPGFISTIDKNHFSTDGILPHTEDKRVSFIKGLFQETLKSFISDNQFHNRLVINMDADLYSSTLYVLTNLDEFMVPGTIIFFDEFSSVLSEFRALEDYTGSYLRKYWLLGATKTPNDFYSHIAIEIL